MAFAKTASSSAVSEARLVGKSRMEHWKNDTDETGKPKSSKTNLSHFCFVHHNPHSCPDTEHGPSWWEASG
jgi:hypothetical protein